MPPMLELDEIASMADLGCRHNSTVSCDGVSLRLASDEEGPITWLLTYLGAYYQVSRDKRAHSYSVLCASNVSLFDGLTALLERGVYLGEDCTYQRQGVRDYLLGDSLCRQ